MSVHIHLYLSYLQSCSMAVGIQNKTFETPRYLITKEKNIYYQSKKSFYAILEQLSEYRVETKKYLLNNYL